MSSPPPGDASAADGLSPVPPVVASAPGGTRDSASASRRPSRARARRAFHWWFWRIGCALVAVPFLGLVLLAYSCNQQHAYWDDGERRLELHFGWDPADDRLAVEEFLWKNYGLDNTFAWKLRIADPSGIPEIAAGGWVRLEPAGRGPLGAPPEPEAPWWGAEPHAAEGELWEYRGDEDFWRIWYDPTTGVAYIDYAEW